VELKYKQTLEIPFPTILWKSNNSEFRFVPQHLTEENMLSILFAGTGNFCFEPLSQNVAAEKCQK
jgi:hypothetical protein